jgi:4-hydroxy-3-methylbut-2-en-1-yl diphosphate reductase
MPVNIVKVKENGFCYGVKRAIRILEKAATENGTVDCLGDLVHNPQVMQRLSLQGVNVIESPQQVKSPAVAISAHGVGPQLESDLAELPIRLIDATCPSVKKVHKAVHRLARQGYSVIVFGDASHAEVKGILGWARGKGQATVNVDELFTGTVWPRKIGLVSQTTQVLENYLDFINAVLARALTGQSEIIILDTVCQGVRRRQSLSRDLAVRSDLMLVIGGKASANSQRLVALCTPLTETHLIETAADINLLWLKGKHNIGVTSGTSTSEDTITEVMQALNNFAV